MATGLELLHIPLSTEIEALAREVHGKASAEMFPVLDSAEEANLNAATGAASPDSCRSKATDRMIGRQGSAESTGVLRRASAARRLVLARTAARGRPQPGLRRRSRCCKRSKERSHH